MKTYRLLIGFLLFLALPAMAQKRKAPQLTPEQQAHKAKLEKMTANTQRIMFIDSMVVDKQHFLQYYKLSPEIGRVARYQDFFHTQQQPNAYVYVNELGTRCYLSQIGKPLKLEIGIDILIPVGTIILRVRELACT